MRRSENVSTGGFNAPATDMPDLVVSARQKSTLNIESRYVSLLLSPSPPIFYDDTTQKLHYFLVPLMSEGMPSGVLFDDLHGLLITCSYSSSSTSFFWLTVS